MKNVCKKILVFCENFSITLYTGLENLSFMVKERTGKGIKTVHYKDKNGKILKTYSYEYEARPIRKKSELEKIQED